MTTLKYFIRGKQRALSWFLYESLKTLYFCFAGLFSVVVHLSYSTEGSIPREHILRKNI